MDYVNGRGPMELSKIGDPLTNLLFSMALSRVRGRPVGRKVSNTVLSAALSKTRLREHAGSRMTKGDLGDYVEGLIFQNWAEGRVSMDAAVSILAENLTSDSKGTELKFESIAAFECLLNHIASL
ncbi:hypothetical protein BMS3Abin16_00214 [archaeon BMS3Abin16]|nr:hypothetical protein BMS3Abin16_00214 [archaeon BMS3Abin16]GBE56188.1 hypothetical protein BMS3Bbin16_00387 [archaeon BMS3Bbin16]